MDNKMKTINVVSVAKGVVVMMMVVVQVVVVEASDLRVMSWTDLYV